MEVNTASYTFLPEQVWQRILNTGGEVHFMGAKIYISRKLTRQSVTVTFDPLEKQWLIRNKNGAILKTSTRGVPTEQGVKNFAIMSKNLEPI